MKSHRSLFDDLPESDIADIREEAKSSQYKKGDVVFSQGDQGDAFFIIDSGAIVIQFDDKGETRTLCDLGPGEYFGEMGIINNDRRSASATAKEDTTLLRLSRKKFLSMTETHPNLINRISGILVQRNQELILREGLADSTGLRRDNLYVSIKGDPSLRETAMFRERYESPADKIINELQPALEDLLINRCIYQLTLNFNSGEVRVHTVFDPFRDKVHTVDRLIDPAYINRHFIKIGYEDKLDMIEQTYQALSKRPQFKRLPEQWINIFNTSREQAAPLSPTEISDIMSQLSALRNVPEFYLRSVSIGIMQDAIRLQFNCDGTHIVSAEGYQTFIKQNFEL